ncbi:NlpC/P60 family protein [Clostridium ganghwense]|uniref:NlpC/P60 family protein n=1 Tax=Clostridium ganghwense TaxID=312089 RepID=A0ABT4CPA1_9CLOT|nr:C40 family peptidase [Clostridium ganghwense]MCY6369901.1 NlpC/P60 family protein [Clostridium ganghwense]
MHKKLTSLLVIVLTTTMNATIVQAAPISNNANQQVKLQQYKANLEKAEKKVEELEQNIEHFDYEIESKMIELNNTKSKIEEAKNHIKVAEKDIEKIDKDIEEEKKLYNDRIRNMYMQGMGGYLEVILGAKDLSDLFFRLEALKKIWELDRKILNSLNEKQDKIKNKKEQLLLENDKLLSLQAKQEKEMEDFKQNKIQQEKLIAEAEKLTKLYADKVKKEEKKVSQNTTKYIPSRGSSASVSQDAMIAYAKKFLGTPYKWGANGPNYFDCSGYTKYIFAKFGINIPRVSRDQAKGGRYVPKNQLQPGDLVFYAYNKGKGAIHHVGMYIGNGKYIHAPRTGDVVKISSVNRSDYATARRYK